MPSAFPIEWPHHIRSPPLAMPFLLLLLLILLLFSAASSAAVDDASALLAFKSALSDSRRLSSWQNASAACSSWHGVTCSGGRVTELRLPGLALRGSIAAGTLGSLDSVQIISLRENFLYGTLPSDIVNCTSLRQLVLANNNFSGGLPSDTMLSAWPLLQKLDVGFNSFSGSIPDSVGQLPKLRHLLLQNNLLSDSIPSSLDSIAPSLKSFSVANNRLAGTIPSSLQRFGESSFSGNPDLCGPPLPTVCSSQTPSPSPYPSSPSTKSSPWPSPPSSSKGLGPGAIAAIVVGSIACAAVVLAVCLMLCWRRRRPPAAAAKREDMFAIGREEFNRRMMRRNSSRLAATTAAPPPPAPGRSRFTDKSKQSFDMNDLLRASAELLGKGSLGTVYKVEMESGMMLCVKRLRRRSGAPPPAEAAIIEVESEETALCRRILENLCSLSHPNLVPLRAHFIDRNEKLLISDYVPLQSLSDLLHGSKGRKASAPDWRRRLAAAGDAATGIVFLHSKKVVHGSIKSTNLLMDGGDARGEAMWTDYGLLPVAAAGGTTPPATGYTPPEALNDPAKMSYKGDVYAFGVLLLEMLTGRQPAQQQQKGGGAAGGVAALPEWVESHPSKVEALDQRMLKDQQRWRRRQEEEEEEEVVEEMLCLLRIAMSCVAAAPDRRPHMVEVVKQIADLRYQPSWSAAYL